MDNVENIVLDLLKSNEFIELHNKLRNNKQIIKKSSEESLKMLIKGRTLLTQHKLDKHQEIWECYTRSIALAPLSSEQLANSYYQRSLLLFDIGKYSDSFSDIEKALNITQDKELKAKLYCNKTLCFSALNNNEKFLAWNELIIILKTISNAERSEELNKLILKAKAAIDSELKYTIENKPLYECPCESEAVKVAYSDEYGRHLIADRDIRVGELVCVEVPYINSPNVNNAYAYCAHCLNLSWSSIPCNYCSWCVFCSDKCKDEAWEHYHEFECSLMPYLKCEAFLNYWRQFGLRMFLKGIKESGSITNLKNDLENIHKNWEKCKIGPLNDENVYTNSFKDLYTLFDSYSFNIYKSFLMDSVLMILITIVNCTNLFENSAVLRTGSNWSRDGEVVFAGALLMRIFTIVIDNSKMVINWSNQCKNKFKDIVCRLQSCCPRGMCLGLLSSFMNQSNLPNVCRVHTWDNKIIYYCVRPITKNSLILDSLFGTFCEWTNLNPTQQSYCIDFKEMDNFLKEQQIISEMEDSFKRPSEIYFDNDKLVTHGFIRENYIKLILPNYSYLENETWELSHNIEIAIENNENNTLDDVISFLITVLRRNFDEWFGVKLQIKTSCNYILNDYDDS